MVTRQFGSTWWGQAWLEALEQRALLDPNRLPRGRTYARQDRVKNIELEPGLIRAEVHGNDTYIATLGVALLNNTEWDALLDEVVGRAKLAAALLSGEVPHELHEILLPGVGDLIPDCNCPDGAEPCKHSAALCYVAADLFDVDPFALLLLRGRSREQVLNELRSRRAAMLGTPEAAVESNRPRGNDPGTSASNAFRHEPEPLGRSIVAPAIPRTMRRLAVAPPADSGIDESELRELVADGARRAQAMLAGEATSLLDLTVGADVARRAIVGDVVAIAETTNLPVGELAAAAKAFYYGGQAGISAARQRWDAGEALLRPGVDALRALVAGGVEPKRRANTVSVGSVQLRVDNEGRWWRFDADDDLGWLLSAVSAADPSDLV